jgi:hypothetical protein
MQYLYLVANILFSNCGTTQHFTLFVLNAFNAAPDERKTVFRKRFRGRFAIFSTA